MRAGIAPAGQVLLMARLLTLGCLGLGATGLAASVVFGLAWLGANYGGELGMGLGVGAASLVILGGLLWLKGR